MTAESMTFDEYGYVARRVISAIEDCDDNPRLAELLGEDGIKTIADLINVMAAIDTELCRRGTLADRVLATAVRW